MFKGAQYFKNDIEKHIETSFTIAIAYFCLIS